MPSHSVSRVAFSAVLLTSILGTPALAAAVPPGTPAPAAAAAKADPRLVNVKFKDNTDVIAASDALSFGDPNTQVRIDRILGRANTDRIEPVFAVAPATLDAKRQQLASRGKNVADLTSYVQVKIEADDDPQVILAKLNSDPQVEAAYVVPASAPAPATPDLSWRQTGYWASAATTPPGLGIAAASGVPGALGDNVKVIDLEYGINIDHEDLVRSPRTVDRLTPNAVGMPVDQLEHGTATAGVIAAKRDGIGVDGIAPNVTYRFHSERSPNRPTSILNAAAQMVPGDVMVLEMQTWGPPRPWTTNYVPAEYDLAVYDAVRTAVAAGVIVVAAAGNGNVNLDDADFANTFAQGKPNSGAIIVGAGNPPQCWDQPTLSRLSFSTYGQRVDVQAPGWCVAAPGYGTLFGDNDGVIDNDDYVDFSGTSSATAVTGGIVAALSSAYEAATGAPLTPQAARAALVQTGSAQTDGPTPGKIGPASNLAAAITYVNATPDTQIVGAPTGTMTQPTFAFSSTSSTSVVGYDCRFVPIGGTAPNFEPCSGPASHTPAAPLADGQYRFEVRARKGPAGGVDPTPATKLVWVVTEAGDVNVDANKQLNVVAFPDRENAITVGQTGSSYFVQDQHKLKAGAGCTQLALTAVFCVNSAMNAVSVRSGDRNDTIMVETSKLANLNGGDGDDVVQSTGPQFDFLAGGAGSDIVSYSNATVPVRASLDGLLNDGPQGSSVDLISSDVEGLTGGSANDTLAGGTAFARLSGGPGDDVITAGAGGSLLDGGVGSDTLTGGSGDDAVDYRDRTDDLTISLIALGAAGDETLGFDTFAGTIEAAYGGQGSDAMVDAAGTQRLYGGPGHDQFWMFGGGDDRVEGGEGDDSFLDGVGNDRYFGDGGADTFELYATGGSDEVNGGADSDTVSYGALTTAVTVSNDGILNDGVPSSAANLDNVKQDIENIRTGSGNDTIIASGNTGMLYGQGGDDTFVMPSGGGINGGTGVDKVDFSARTTGLTMVPLTTANRSILVQFAGGGFAVTYQVDHVIGTPLADTMVSGTGRSGEWPMTLDGRGGNDTLNGGLADDVLIGGAGIDTLRGGSGNDQLKAKDAVPGEQLTCGAGTDQVERDSGDVLVDGVACETVTS